MSKVIAINGSPRMGNGYTAVVLEPFLQGMRDAGAEVELVYASRLKLKPCSCGVMHCWYREPGKCCVNDEMQELYPRLRAAETLVLATPVYSPLPGGMQDVVNRLCALIEPRLEMREGRTRARFRADVGIRRIALVATGGWWEKANLATVGRVVEELAADASVKFAGAVLRPHAFLLKQGGELTADAQAVLEAVRAAGRELATEGAMRAETLDAIGRSLIAEDELVRRYNEALPG